MFENLYSQQEAASNQAKEDFKFKLAVITDENIRAVFENFSKDEIVSMLTADKVWFKLCDRQLSRDCVESMLSQHNEIMLDIIRGGSIIEAELYKMAVREVEEIISDYEVINVS